MAYDQNTPYQAPRRANYGQARQQAPDYASYARHENQQYAQYDQSYGQEYHQQTEGGYNDFYDYGEYDQYSQQEHEGHYWQENDAYNESHAQNGYHEQHASGGHFRQPQERNYDPRYQQRGSRGASGQHRPDGPGPRLPPERQGYQIQPSNQTRQTRQAPRMNGAGTGYDQPSSGPRARGGGGPPQSHSQQQFRSRNQANAPGNDWRAQEKAKMNSNATSPAYVPQDTAFPRIGNKQERPGTSGGKDNPRPSGDQQQPGTARPDGRARRPSASRGPSFTEEAAPGGHYSYQRSRPEYGRQPAGGAPQDRHNGGPTQAYGQDYSQRQQAQIAPQTAYLANDAIDDRRRQEWPLGSHQGSAPAPARERQGPAQAGGYDSAYDAGPRAPRAQPSGPGRFYQDDRPHQQQPPTRNPPSIQTLDTNVQQHNLAFLEHNPLSPVEVAPRPATASGARRAPAQYVAGSVAQAPQAATIESYAAPKSWMQHTKTASLDRLHDAATEPEAEEPKTREEEIEAEMPDFDTPAPEPSSSLHKRSQTVDRHLNDTDIVATPPPMPLVPTQYADQQSRGHREQQYPPQSYNSQQEFNSSQPPVVGQGGGHHSMDNAKGLPYRPGPPPGQRSYPQAPPGTGARRPQQPNMPGLERAGTAPSTFSDSVQQRAASVPPQSQRSNQPLDMSRARGMQDPQYDRPQARNSNPDALPHHPAPVRPGLMEQGSAQPTRPPPVRNYNNGSTQSAPTASQGQQATSTDDPFAHPVTREELGRLRADVEANPSSPKRALLLAKKLVEAATVLASENGRLDARATAKNRERYTTEGYKRVKKLVAAGYPEAQFYLADCYGQGLLGLEADPKEAFNLYQAAAKQGHGQAAYRTAVCCEMGAEDGGGTRRDYAKALQWYRRAAALGDAAAMFKLGAVLSKGLLGQPRSIGEAVTWLKRAAERADAEHPHALHELAALYDSANGDADVRNKVLADDAHARDLFVRAAKFGYKASQFRLGQAHEYGSLGLPIDNRQSIMWYSKAAAQGEHQAELALSGWYLTGAEGILEHSDTEAYLWARKAAMSEPPLAKALFAMGYFTETGIGCPASLEEARKWYGRAASLKFPKALERLEELKRNGGKGPRAPNNRQISRKDQKRDEAECVVM